MNIKTNLKGYIIKYTKLLFLEIIRVNVFLQVWFTKSLELLLYALLLLSVRFNFFLDHIYIYFSNFFEVFSSKIFYCVHFFIVIISTHFNF